MHRLAWRLVLAAAATAALLTGSTGEAGQVARKTAVSIRGERFLINGRTTYPKTPIEGLLMNSRMVQAIFDDENPSTVVRWRYPDTNSWSPARNTREFVAALPRYAARGLRAVTVGLQGGNPVPGHAARIQPWVVSAYRPDGTLKSSWLQRLDRVASAADQSGVVVILTLFYFGQDERLSDESAVVRAVDSVTDWVLARGYRNIMIEVANEADHAYDHPILQPARIAELVQRVRARSGGRIMASTSFGGGVIPTAAVLSAADYILVHGNGQSAEAIREMVRTIRASAAFRAAPKPVIFNEDSTSVANLDAAVSTRASWGYYDKGENNYRRGFQAPPVNWTINTPQKRVFFRRLSELARLG
jgi:hypothetical protein